jgi:hypothetical protein
MKRGAQREHPAETRAAPVKRAFAAGGTVPQPRPLPPAEAGRGFPFGLRRARNRSVVDLERSAATLFRDSRAVFRAPVGVGMPSSPTPRGDILRLGRLMPVGTPLTVR